VTLVHIMFCTVKNSSEITLLTEISIDNYSLMMLSWMILRLKSTTSNRCACFVGRMQCCLLSQYLTSLTARGLWLSRNDDNYEAVKMHLV